MSDREFVIQHFFLINICLGRPRSSWRQKRTTSFRRKEGRQKGAEVCRPFDCRRMPQKRSRELPKEFLREVERTRTSLQREDDSRAARERCGGREDERKGNPKHWHIEKGGIHVPQVTGDLERTGGKQEQKEQNGMKDPGQQELSQQQQKQQQKQDVQQQDAQPLPDEMKQDQVQGHCSEMSYLQENQKRLEGEEEVDQDLQQRNQQAQTPATRPSALSRSVQEASCVVVVSSELGRMHLLVPVCCGHVRISKM